MATTGQRWRDGVALVVVAAVIATYGVLLASGSVGFIQDPRAMGSIGLLSALLLCPLSGGNQRPGWWLTAISLLGTATLGLGIAAVVTVGWGVLAAFMIAIAAMWLVSTLHHAFEAGQAPPPRRAAARAAAGSSPAHEPGSVLVAYASRNGFTEGIAERLAATLRASGHPAELRRAAGVADAAGYDAYVIGSAAYIGSWLREATDFVRRNQPALASRPVWLFSSGPLGTSPTDAKGRDLLTQSEPRQFAELRGSLAPRGTQVFYGGLDPSRLHGMARAMRRAPAARQLMPEGDFRDWPAIDAWAESIARELDAIPAAN
jgi:menaquinone-dependent protoporphyrinogen oxidase